MIYYYSGSIFLTKELLWMITQNQMHLTNKIWFLYSFQKKFMFEKYFRINMTFNLDLCQIIKLYKKYGCLFLYVISFLVVSEKADNYRS